MVKEDRTYQLAELSCDGSLLIVIKQGEVVHNRPESQEGRRLGVEMVLNKLDQLLNRLLSHELQLGLRIFAFESQRLGYKAEIRMLRVMHWQSRQSRA